MRGPSSRPWLASAAVATPFAVVVAVHARYYLPFVADDALISLRYADRLLEGKGLTWTEGQAVEGYSNLLWILLTALVGGAGIDLLAAARAVGLATTIGTLYALSRSHLGNVVFRDAVVPLGVALLFVSLAAPVAVWAIGGLEAPLLGALLATSVGLAYGVLDSAERKRGRLMALSVVLGLMCITRPDGPLFSVATAVSVLVFGRRLSWSFAVSRMLWILLFPILFTGGQLVFRLFYYGEWVPNTALVKVTLSASHRVAGWQYLKSGAGALWPLSGLAVVSLLGMLFSPALWRRGAHLGVLLAVWSSYIVLVSGDIMPAHRHVVPLIVVLAFAMCGGLGLLAHALAPRHWLLRLLPLLAVLWLFVPFVERQFAHGENRRAVFERWEWIGRDVGLLLRSAFHRQKPLVAVTAAGCIPYWSELPSLDMLGLNDYYLPRHPPQDFGRGWLGHELGDGQYVLDRRPDIIVFNVGSEPGFRSGEQLNALPEFHERYVPVTALVLPSEHRALLYLHRYSTAIGITKFGAAVTVPGYLFARGDTVAQLNVANRLVARLPPQATARLEFDVGSFEAGSADVVASAAAAVVSNVTQKGQVVTVELRSSSAEPVDVEEVVVRSAGPR